jgi:endonuclease/exonuclease/phosphatase family metal-dependent hydrolase
MLESLTFHNKLRPLLTELAKFESTVELESSPLYQKVRGDIEELLNHVWHEQLAPGTQPFRNRIQAMAWNIERGLYLDAITHYLTVHPELSCADVLLLSELDWGMARTGNRFVAREIASRLRLNYAFAPCYVALTKGAGAEKEVVGENEESLHGNALFSPHALHRVHSVALPNGKDKMKGAEKRIGCQRAVIADIAHPSGTFRAVSLHLDAHSSQRHRQRQLRFLLDHLDRLSPRLPVLIGGDWNTTTHNASRALYSILGYCRRVLIGVRRVVTVHYPYPEYWFERHLFRELEQRGYNYRDLNVAGECTLHYSVRDIAANLNMGEWIPQWCFWFINWALERTGGTCSLKLDWFAGKGLQLNSKDPTQAPSVIHGLSDAGHALSDHDPIAIAFELAN